MPMKVAIVSRFPQDESAPRGGVEAVTVVLARALAEVPGMEVAVLTFGDPLESAVTELVGAVSVHRLPSSRWPQIIDIHCGPSRRRLIEKLEELRPDIVHWHETWGLPGGYAGYQQVMTIHGFDSENVIAQCAKWAKLRSLAWRIVEWRGFARHRHVISINPYVARKLENRVVGKIHAINNPLDGRFFNVIRREAEIPRVLCVGWINPRKNTLTSVLAFIAALKAGHPGRLVLAGAASDTAYMARITAAICEHGAAQHVDVLGHVDHATLSDELSRASVFLLPSLQENAPMAIAEAMAVGVPVISSNRCGMPFMVEEGKSGYLVDTANIDQTTDRLCRLLADPELRQEMGRRGRELALGCYFPSKIAAQTIRVYQEILGNPSP